MHPSPQKSTELAARMSALGVREEDLEEEFVRSQGAGGQNVNKRSSCVILVHRPTGIRVKCQTERSQALNRFLARRRLCDELERRRRGFVAAERARIERIRRQKRKRSRRARDRMLADKAHHAEKKRMRSGVRSDE
jgi:protein subunit release factor B